MTVTADPAARSGGPAPGPPPSTTPWLEKLRRALVGAPVHAGVAPGRRRGLARADRDPAGQSDQKRRRAVHLGGSENAPRTAPARLSVITPMRFFCGLALANETGLLHFELRGAEKEIFLVGGAPESVSSSGGGERFGEYLVGRGVLGPADSQLALSMLPHYNGKLGDTFVALGMLRPLDVFRLLSEQVRDWGD